MKDFLLSNWKEFVIILLTFAALLVSIFRSKKIDTSISSICSELPELIDIAERKFGAGRGEQKKNYVLSCACALYKHATGVILEPSSSIYKRFEASIEEILCTPQKKGK